MATSSVPINVPSVCAPIGTVDDCSECTPTSDALPSEGKGHTFESCRVRHEIKGLAESWNLSVPVVSQFESVEQSASFAVIFWPRSADAISRCNQISQWRSPISTAVGRCAFRAPSVTFTVAPGCPQSDRYLRGPDGVTT